MKISFQDLKKIYDYIEKYADKGNLNVAVVYESSIEYLQFTFHTLTGESIKIQVPESDKGLFIKITTTKILG